MPEINSVNHSLGRTVFVYQQHHTSLLLKRALDIIVSGLALLIASPFLLVAAVLIFLDDRGPLLFRQKRVGRFGRLFTVYKLRTMRVDLCGDALSPNTTGDARITRVGYYLRKFSIDELPQLFNVFVGDMTLVGPRPEMPFIVRQYAPWQQLRHIVKPGLTGLWQVTCRSTIPLHHPEATAIDLDYISKATLKFDGEILFRTFRAVFFPQGAY